MSMDKHQHYTKASIQTADALPLAALRLGDDAGLVNGADWDVAALEKGDCVSVWKNKDEPRLPDDLVCNQVGVGLVREEKRSSFASLRSAFIMTVNWSAFVRRNKQSVFSTFLEPLCA